jgi:hypothetical protein
MAFVAMIRIKHMVTLGVAGQRDGRSASALNIDQRDKICVVLNNGNVFGKTREA